MNQRQALLTVGFIVLMTISLGWAANGYIQWLSVWGDVPKVQITYSAEMQGNSYIAVPMIVFFGGLFLISWFWGED